MNLKQRRYRQLQPPPPPFPTKRISITHATTRKFNLEKIRSSDFFRLLFVPIRSCYLRLISPKGNFHVNLKIILANLTNF